MSYQNRKEIWKPTKYKDYIVSNTGQVTSLKYYNVDKKYQRTLSQNPDKDGYMTCTLSTVKKILQDSCKILQDSSKNLMKIHRKLTRS